MKLNIALFAIFELLLSGCATVDGPSFQDAPKPNEKDVVILYVYRVGPYQLTTDLMINKEKAVKFDMGFTWFTLEEGVYEFNVKIPFDLNLKLKYEEMLVKAESPYYMRIFISGYLLSSQLVTEEIAMKELIKLKYMEPIKDKFEPKIRID
jgi:hypothetical protein